MNTIVLCLRSGGDFAFSDVELISHHIRRNYHSRTPLQILCLSDKVDQVFELRNCTLMPTPHKQWKGWWTKMNLFSPEMKQYRPFLYLDLDTAVVDDISDLFNRQETGIIGLDDFYHNGKFASGVMWIPENGGEADAIWIAWMKEPDTHIKKYRGDQNFISNFILSNVRWQTISNKICSFKVRTDDRSWLSGIPDEVSVVCFHGHPRIKDAQYVDWVHTYVQQKRTKTPKVTVIIPYKKDRGWLKEAVESVPSWVQLLVSKGEGDWAENFNKALPQATGDYIKFLHEDDMLSPNSILDSVEAIDSQGVDFVHGKAFDMSPEGCLGDEYRPPKNITYEYLKNNNHIHGGTLMFRREVFKELVGYKESMHHSEEYEFNLRAMQRGFRLGYCDEVLYYYRRHEGQKSSKFKGDLDRMGRKVSEEHQKEFNA